MTVLIEEMIAGTPKNMLQPQSEHLPRYTNEEKKTILRENYAPPSLLTKTLSTMEKEMQDMNKKVTNTRRFVNSQQLNSISTIPNEQNEIKDGLKVIPEASSIKSIPSEELKLSVATLQSNEKIIATEMPNKKSKSHIDDCEPIVARFGSKEILDTIGIGITIPKLPKLTSAPKINSLLEKKKKYPRISAVHINK